MVFSFGDCYMTTAVESNKQVVRQYVDAFNQGDLAALRELFTSDASIQGVLGWGGLDVVMPIWKELHEAFKIQLTVDEIITEGDFVAVRYIERGTSVGAFRGNPPTGKPYEVVAMEWFALRDGKIHRRWGARDSASISRQIAM
jgi:steroid delta-isomerase-like uncharacterized protein